MPTILTHAVIPLAIGIGLGSRIIPAPLLAAGVALAMLPDADIVSFGFGIPYADALGHRGASHSLTAALILALGCAIGLRSAAVPLARAAAFLFLAAASHGIADMFTNGGLGIALLWPFSDARLFAPWTPIQVSPIGLSRFLSGDASAVLASEMLWIWLPCAALALLLRLRTRLFRKPA